LGVTSWNGVFCPLVTPFNFEEELYPAKILHNIARLESIALAGYVVASPTGEGEMLSFDETIRLLELVAGATKKPKVVSTHLASVRESARLIGAASELGYAGAIVDRGDDFHIRCVQDRVSLPVLREPLNAPPLANAVPYVYQTIFEAERSRETEAANDWRERLKPALAAFERYGVPGLKCVMDRFGYYGGPPRLPRVPLKSSEAAEMAAAFDGLRS
jgi:dihydrodipicolinate synthase/N-acetylneuraminate lyase